MLMQTVYIYVSHKSPFFDQYVTFFYLISKINTGGSR